VLAEAMARLAGYASSRTTEVIKLRDSYRSRTA
jgi:hypothetical protein